MNAIADHAAVFTGTVAAGLMRPGSNARSRAGDAGQGLVEALSQTLQRPVDEVRQIYQQQLDRLAAGARVQTFLGALAIRHTRSILRGGPPAC